MTFYNEIKNNDFYNQNDLTVYFLKLITYTAFLILIIYFVILSKDELKQTSLNKSVTNPWNKSIYVLKSLIKNTNITKKYPYLQKRMSMWENNARNQKCISKAFRQHRAKIAAANSKDKKHIRFSHHPEKSFFLNMKCIKGPHGYTWTKVI